MVNGARSRSIIGLFLEEKSLYSQVHKREKKILADIDGNIFQRFIGISGFHSSSSRYTLYYTRPFYFDVYKLTVISVFRRTSRNYYTGARRDAQHNIVE